MVSMLVGVLAGIGGIGYACFLWGHERGWGKGVDHGTQLGRQAGFVAGRELGRAETSATYEAALDRAMEIKRDQVAA